MAYDLELYALGSVKALSLKNLIIFLLVLGYLQSSLQTLMFTQSLCKALLRRPIQPVLSLLSPGPVFLSDSSRSCSCLLTSDLLLPYQDKAHFLWPLAFSSIQLLSRGFFPPSYFKTKKLHHTEQLFSEQVSKFYRTHDFCICSSHILRDEGRGIMCKGEIVQFPVTCCWSLPFPSSLTSQQAQVQTSHRVNTKEISKDGQEDLHTQLFLLISFHACLQTVLSIPDTLTSLIMHLFLPQFPQFLLGSL